MINKLYMKDIHNVGKQTKSYETKNHGSYAQH